MPIDLTRYQDIRRLVSCVWIDSRVQRRHGTQVQLMPCSRGALSVASPLSHDEVGAVLRFPSKLRNFWNTSIGHGLLTFAVTILLRTFCMKLIQLPKIQNHSPQVAVQKTLLIDSKAFTCTTCAAQAPQVLSESGHSPVKILTAGASWSSDNSKA